MKKYVVMMMFIPSLYASGFEDISVRVGAGIENVQVLDHSGVAATLAVSAFMPEVHALIPNFLMEVELTQSVVELSNDATVNSEAYSTSLSTASLYLGYQFYVGERFNIRPKIGTGITYASISDKARVDFSYALSIGYEFPRTALFIAYTAIGEVNISSIGIAYVF